MIGHLPDRPERPLTRPDYRFCPRCRSPLEERERGGAMRAMCLSPGCGFTHWDNPVPVVAAIVEHDGHVILVRSHGWPEHAFGLVAGFLERGESPEQGVLREIREEIGIAAEISELVGVYGFELRNQLLLVYHARALEGDIRLGEDELAAYKRVPVHALKPWPRGTGPALRDWLVARGYDPEIVEFGHARYD